MIHNIYSTLAIMFVMLISTLAVSYFMFAFVTYDIPSNIIQATPKYHHTPVQLHEA
jgi:hypothetical protein